MTDEERDIIDNEVQELIKKASEYFNGLQQFCNNLLNNNCIIYINWLRVYISIYNLTMHRDISLQQMT